jgi:hypothetical protein
MKKFTQLITGDSFDYQGQTYLKTGPLTACNIDSGGQRMIPCSALVHPITAPHAPPPEVTPQQLPADRVLAAFEHYHNGCLEWLRLTEELDDELAKKMREAMAIARQRFLADLQQM